MSSKSKKYSLKPERWEVKNDKIIPENTSQNEENIQNEIEFTSNKAIAMDDFKVFIPMKGQNSPFAFLFYKKNDVITDPVVIEFCKKTSKNIKYI